MTSAISPYANANDDVAFAGITSRGIGLYAFDGVDAVVRLAPSMDDFDSAGEPTINLGGDMAYWTVCLGLVNDCGDPLQRAWYQDAAGIPTLLEEIETPTCFLGAPTVTDDQRVTWYSGCSGGPFLIRRWNGITTETLLTVDGDTPEDLLSLPGVAEDGTFVVAASSVDLPAGIYIFGAGPDPELYADLTGGNDLVPSFDTRPFISDIANVDDGGLAYIASFAPAPGPVMLRGIFSGPDADSLVVAEGDVVDHAEVIGGLELFGVNTAGQILFKVLLDDGRNVLVRADRRLDCNRNAIPDDVEIETGIADDCNENGVPDDCDVVDGGDCNDNGVPDDCDVDITDPDGDGMVSDDCDDNDVPDECDPDCDGDGIPDACDPDPGTDCCPGDLNGDGTVDGADLGLLLGNVGRRPAARRSQLRQRVGRRRRPRPAARSVGRLSRSGADPVLWRSQQRWHGRRCRPRSAPR